MNEPVEPAEVFAAIVAALNNPADMDENWCVYSRECMEAVIKLLREVRVEML
jgi:hypothetical protein